MRGCEGSSRTSRRWRAREGMLGGRREMTRVKLEHLRDGHRVLGRGACTRRVGGGIATVRTCMQILVTRAKMRHASVQRRTKRRGCAVSCPSVDCEEIAVCSYTFEDGSSYEGMWKNFLPHGEGTYTWPGGTVYTVCSFSSSNLPFSRHKLVCAEFLPRVKLSGRN